MNWCKNLFFSGCFLSRNKSAEEPTAGSSEAGTDTTPTNWPTSPETELEDPDNIPGLGDEELPHMLLPDSISQLEEFGRHKRPRKAHRGHGRPRLFSDLWVRIGDRWDICYDVRIRYFKSSWICERIDHPVTIYHYRPIQNHVWLLLKASIHTDEQTWWASQGIPWIFTTLSYKTKASSKCSHFRSRNQRFLAIFQKNLSHVHLAVRLFPWSFLPFHTPT